MALDNMEEVKKDIDEAKRSVEKVGNKIEVYETQRQSLQTKIKNAEGDELLKLQEEMKGLDIMLKSEREEKRQLREEKRQLREEKRQLLEIYIRKMPSEGKQTI